MMTVILFAAAAVLSAVSGLFSVAALQSAEQREDQKAAIGLTLWAALQLSALTVAYIAGSQP